jgi:outer membrane immunogenic protein
MKTFPLVLSTLTWSLSVCGSANAADPAAYTAYDWSGFYFGGQVGTQSLDGSVEDPARQDASAGEYSGTGLVYGVLIGINHQSGSIVMGVEADLQGTSTDDTSPRFGFNDVRGTAEIDLQGSLRVRLGYAANNILIYLTGGYAWANADFDYMWAGSPSADDSFSKTLNGWALGSGLEYGWDRWSARLEYRYIDYDRVSSDIVNCCADPPFSQDHDLDTHAILLGIAYHF